MVMACTPPDSGPQNTRKEKAQLTAGYRALAWGGGAQLTSGYRALGWGGTADCGLQSSWMWEGTTDSGVQSPRRELTTDPVLSCSLLCLFPLPVFLTLSCNHQDSSVSRFVPTSDL